MNETQIQTQTETAAIQPKRQSAFNQLAANLNIDKGNLCALLKKTVCPAAASDEEIAAFAIVAGKYKLDPFTKQIYAYPNKQGGMTPVVGIDGWLAIINRQPNFDGMKIIPAADGSSATCIIHLKDRAHPVEITEYLDECKRNTDPWRTMPRRMLRHKAIIQAARVAFNISGIYDEDEARDIAGEEKTTRHTASRVVETNPFETYCAPQPAQIEEPAPAAE